MHIRDLFTKYGGNQMKLNMMKRIGAFLLASSMTLGTTISAFAAEPEEVATEETIIAEYTINTADYDNDPVGGTIASNSSATYYPRLSSYIGFTKQFYAGTSSSSSTGMVLLYLYNPSGKLISNDWILGVNDYGSWNFTLPSSGTYTLRVSVQGTTAPVSIAASWEG